MILFINIDSVSLHLENNFDWWINSDDLEEEK